MRNAELVAPDRDGSDWTANADFPSRNWESATEYKAK
jgi:hypothetical protein